jgi:hypothetical protein
LLIEHTFDSLLCMVDDPGDERGPHVDPARDLPSGLLAADPAELADQDLGAGLLALAQLSGQVDEALARYSTAFDDRSLQRSQGSLTVASWVAARSELDRTRIGSLHRTGRALRSCPVVAEAFRAGQLGTAKVTLLVEARTQVEALFAEHEPVLVDEVAELTIPQARQAIGHWRRIALATVGLDDGAEPDPQPDDSLHLSHSYRGRWSLKGTFSPEAGQRLANALDAVIDAQFRNGAAHRQDGKVRSQRRAIALMDLVARGAQPGTVHGAQRPSVHLNWDAADLLGRPAADAAAAMRKHRCHLDDDTLLPRATAERLLCDADITDVLVHFGLDGNVDVLGVSHTNRYPTAKERKALRQRDRGCVFPGCQAPVGWTDAHHTVPYELGKVTRLDELVLLCRFHHHAVHEGGFVLARLPDGQIHVTQPDGTPLPGAPPGHKVPAPASSHPPSRFPRSA